ncbi:iron chelate uptake ABC transporter family permease subunit [Proteiniclasticum ruminis]
MLFSDTLARTVLAPMEIPVGAVTALFGAPYFILLLYRSKKSGGFL